MSWKSTEFSTKWYWTIYIRSNNFVVKGVACVLSYIWVYTDWFRSIVVPFKHVCERNQTNRRRNNSLWCECKNTMISTNMIRGTCNMNNGCIYESVAETHKFHLRCTDRPKSRCQIIPRLLNNMQKWECLHLICVKQIKSNTQIYSSLCQKSDILLLSI